MEIPMDQQPGFVVLAIRGAVASLPADEQAKFRECEEKMRALMAEYDQVGPFCLALLGAEISARTD